MKERALIVIDVQNEYFDGPLAIHYPSREQSLAHIIEGSRGSTRPIADRHSAAREPKKTRPLSLLDHKDSDCIPHSRHAARLHGIG